MIDLLSILRDWQPLAGAIIGATVSLMVAFLVAHSSRRREDLSSAMVLVGNLTTIISAAATLRYLASRDNVPQKDYSTWMATRLTGRHPALSPLFESCVAKLLPVDVTLAAHLELLQVIYRGVERHLDELREDLKYFREHKELPRSKEDIEADFVVVEKSFAMAERHAVCAERLLSQLVLGNYPTWHRMRRALLPSKADRECTKFLRTGAL